MEKTNKYNIAICGASGVGKSELFNALNKVVTKRRQSYKANKDIKQCSLCWSVDNVKYYVNLYDIPGPGSYEQTDTKYKKRQDTIESCHGFILMFDSSNPVGVRALKPTIEEINTIKQTPDWPHVVVSNKIDKAHSTKDYITERYDVYNELLKVEDLYKYNFGRNTDADILDEPPSKFRLVCVSATKGDNVKRVLDTLLQDLCPHPPESSSADTNKVTFSSSSNHLQKGKTVRRRLTSAFGIVKRRLTSGLL